MPIKVTPLENEETLLVARKLPVRYWKLILAVIMLITLGATSLYFSQNGYLFLAAVILFSLAVIISFLLYLLWHDEVVLISNRRLVMVDKQSLLSHSVSEIDARDIASVGFSQKGLAGLVFRSGALEITDIHGNKQSLENIISVQAAQEVIRTIVNKTHHQ